MEQHLTLEARDGFPLAATVYGGTERGGPVALVASAMAVPRRYYAPFARTLAARGVRVVTFDYRGIGESRRGDLRHLDASLTTWAREDLAGAAAWIDRTLAPERLAWVGHSVGGQLLGLVPEVAARVSCALFVAVQSGHWRLWHGAGRARMWLLWHAAIPALSPVLGYFPGKRLGLGADLPRGVVEEWARWGRHPEYLRGRAEAAGLTALRAPLLSLSFTDDGYAPPDAVARAEGWYTNAALERRALRPQDVGLRGVGHFGFFREAAREALWPLATDWLERRLHAAQSARAR